MSLTLEYSVSLDIPLELLRCLSFPCGLTDLDHHKHAWRKRNMSEEMEVTALETHAPSPPHGMLHWLSLVA